LVSSGVKNDALTPECAFEDELVWKYLTRGGNT
jgi:hypothetical protein